MDIPTDPDSPISASAIHESGHLCMAYHLGLRTLAATIRPGDNDRWVGKTLYLPEELAALAPVERIAVVLAGSVADSLWAGCDPADFVDLLSERDKEVLGAEKVSLKLMLQALDIVASFMAEGGLRVVVDLARMLEANGYVTTCASAESAEAHTQSDAIH